MNEQKPKGTLNDGVFQDVPCIIEEGKDPIYDFRYMKKHFTEIDLDTKDNTNLFVLVEDLKVSWALVRFHSSWDEEEWCSLIWSGCGLAGYLRECRHSYFGEEGYLFYAPLDAIANTATYLRKYFD